MSLLELILFSHNDNLKKVLTSCQTSEHCGVLLITLEYVG